MRARDRFTAGSPIAPAVRGRGPDRPANSQAALLALQRAAGNDAVSRSLVQRAVIVGGAPVHDPVGMLRAGDNHLLMSDTGWRVVEWARAGKATLTAADTEGLVVESERIAAMVELVRSIRNQGILGRRTLTQRQMSFAGSNDRGDTTGLAVNVLDSRGGGHDVGQMVTDSLTAPKNGSFSVAMERPAHEDMVLDQLAEDRLVDAEPTEEDRQKATGLAKGDSQWLPTILKMVVAERQRAGTMTRNQNVFEERVRNTIMAIVRRPAGTIANRDAGGFYESDVPADHIPAGTGGFTLLVLPQWFQPYAPMVRPWPENVEARFVGNRRLTAHFLAGGVDLPVTVDAPDFGSEIQQQLTQFQYLATHILKTGTA